MTTTLERQLSGLFRALLPARTRHGEIALAPRSADPVWRDETGRSYVGLVLLCFDPSGPGLVVDVKEQDVCLGSLDGCAPARFLAYVEGHLRALPTLLERFAEDLLTRMPMDLFGYPEALDDEALATPDDFERALRDEARVLVWTKAREQREYEGELAPCGLGERVAEVRALQRPSIRLHLDRIDDASSEGDDSLGNAPIGTTRVGGAPDLPPSMGWPEVDGHPLGFVAQLDLAALAAFPAAAVLPRRGLLSFFYAPLSFDGAPRNAVRVVHLAERESLERRPLPKGVERVPEHDARAVAERMFPPVESPFYEALLPAETQRTFRASLRAAGAGADVRVVDPLGNIGSVIAQWSEADPERPEDRVLGYASAIQGDPYVDLETDVVRGGYDGWIDDSDEALSLRRSARRWRLLLQIDASGDGEWVLQQDGGFFYFWITEEALAAHDWAQVKGSLQCH